ncbi:MAG: hybrid sensor histidine kinase/response regulator [Desulfobacterales bacterium]|nr:hybrid sensor histidine kinase/response regulator [Desulfobacterales bacterium]
MNNGISLSVLVVDDNSKNLQILADILRSRDFKVATAKDGFKALKFIDKTKPDIILLDIMMPEMDGFEVSRRLKSKEATKDIPIIFISALNDTSDKIKGFRAGGVDYITKPFQEEEVFARINAQLKLKLASKKLKTANKLLQTANATKDKMFSIIAHDLRGPIGSLSQALDILVDSPEIIGTEEQKSTFMKELKASAKRASLLLENLLCWARNQRCEIEYNPADTEFNQIIRNNINLLSGIAKDKTISLTSEINESLRVYADTDMIMTVVRNLISNALKFTPENGKVTVSAVLKDDFIEISVVDTGVGISENDTEKLFSPDEHFTTYGTQNEKGSGLGLLLCKDFVEKNNGKIWVETEEGKGSKFKFTLPKTKEHK